MRRFTATMCLNRNIRKGKAHREGNISCIARLFSSSAGGLLLLQRGDVRSFEGTNSRCSLPCQAKVRTNNKTKRKRQKQRDRLLNRSAVLLMQYCMKYIIILCILLSITLSFCIFFFVLFGGFASQRLRRVQRSGCNGKQNFRGGKAT